MRSKTCCSMAEWRGLHALLAAFFHITDTSRLLTVMKADKKAIFTAASKASEAAAFLAALQGEQPLSE